MCTLLFIFIVNHFSFICLFIYLFVLTCPYFFLSAVSEQEIVFAVSKKYIFLKVKKQN